jgi:hypothetical protein
MFLTFLVARANSSHPPGGVAHIFDFRESLGLNRVPPQGLAQRTRVKSADSLDVAASRDLIRI